MKNVLLVFTLLFALNECEGQDSANQHKEQQFTVRVGAKSNGDTLSIAVLKAQPGIFVQEEVFGKESPQRGLVKKYSLIIMRDRSVFYSKEFDGPYFNKEIWSLFNRVQPGDVLRIANISGDAYPGKNLLFPSIEIVLVE